MDHPTRMNEELEVLATKDDDAKFRGALERFLLFSLLGLKSIDKDDDGLGGPFVEAFKMLQTSLSGGDIAKAQVYMGHMMDGLGFSPEFKANFKLLRNEGPLQNDFKAFCDALLTLKRISLFDDAYTGTGCRSGLMRMVKTARESQLRVEA